MNTKSHPIYLIARLGRRLLYPLFILFPEEEEVGHHVRGRDGQGAVAQGIGPPLAVADQCLRGKEIYTYCKLKQLAFIFYGLQDIVKVQWERTSEFIFQLT